MESLLFLLGLLLLAIPLIAIIALTRTITLGEHFRRLDARLAAIERGYHRPGGTGFSIELGVPEDEWVEELA